MKAAINNTLMRSLPAGPVDIRDTRLPGFVLRVWKSGKTSYRVQYRRGKWYTIGSAEHLKPAEAREQAQKILGEAAKGNDPGAAKKRARAATLRDYLRNVYHPWLEVHRKDGAATFNRLMACFDAELGGTRLPELTAWQVEKWKTQRLKAGRAPATIQRDIGALKSALNRAAEWGYIGANPIANVKPPSKQDQNTTPRFLSEDEAQRLRDALIEREERHRQERRSANAWRRARGYPTMPEPDGTFTDHLRPIVLLALNTGMRRGEILGLEWDAVDLGPAPSVEVRGAGAKTGQTRHIPLNNEARAVLADWQRDTDRDTGLVFPGDDGERMHSLKTAWANVLKGAKIEAFRFHDLRHTFASWLVMRGVDLNTVRDLMGHTDLKMTLRYAHLAPEVKARAVDTLAGATG